MRHKGLAGLIFLGAVVVIGASIGGTSTAEARDDWFFGFNNHGDFTIGFRHTDRGYRHYDRRHRYGYAPYKRHRYRGPRYRSRHVYRNRHWGPPPRFARSYGSCHQVWRPGHWRGRRAHVGGLMCYDRHGYAHIRPGSEYFIRYY